MPTLLSTCLPYHSSSANTSPPLTQPLHFLFLASDVPTHIQCSPFVSLFQISTNVNKPLSSCYMQNPPIASVVQMRTIHPSPARPSLPGGVLAPSQPPDWPKISSGLDTGHCIRDKQTSAKPILRLVVRFHFYGTYLK